MLNTPVGAPTSEPAPVRPVDVGPAAWTLARAYAPGRSAAVAALTWPVLALLVLVVPGFAHDGRDVVVCLSRRRSAPRASAVAWYLLVCLVAGAALGTVAAAVGSVTGSASAGWLVATGWPASGLAVLAVGWVVVSVRIARIHRDALHTLGPVQRRADRAVVRAARWRVGWFAARPGTHGLPVVAQHVRAVVPPGETVMVVAASERHARAYARHGLRPLPTLPLVLVGTVGADR